jgi:hypothetical protein
MQGRGRPEKLTEELEDQIRKIKDQHPKITVKRIQEELRLYLFKAKKGKNPDINDQEIMKIIDTEELPGESSITKFLGQNIQNPIEIDKTIKDLDIPWSIGCCIEHNIPPDFIPVLLEYRKINSGSQREYLTIRKARWMARLYPTIKKYLENEAPYDFVKQILFLATVASEYASNEEAANKNKRLSSNTKTLDLFLFVDSAKGDLSNCELSFTEKIDVILGEYEGD